MILRLIYLQVIENERRVALSSAYEDGFVELQDTSSQQAISALDITKGQRVLDLCAGGGGKALAIAARGVDVTAHDIDDAVISVLEASPFADRIRTKTGHGLGRDVHEAPYIMRGNHMILPAGTVYTNEPGLYEIGNFGVRIEDDVLITSDGYRSLTNFPKELMVISC